MLLSAGESFIQFITVLIIFVLVLGITYFVTKYVGKFQKAQVTRANIEVVEATKISTSAYAEILRVGDKYIAVAVSKDNVTYLCEVDGETVITRQASDISQTDFSGILAKAKSLVTKDDNAKSDE